MSSLGLYSWIDVFPDMIETEHDVRDYCNLQLTYEAESVYRAFNASSTLELRTELVLGERSYEDSLQEQGVSDLFLLHFLCASDPVYPVTPLTSILMGVSQVREFNHLSNIAQMLSSPLSHLNLDVLTSSVRECIARNGYNNWKEPKDRDLDIYGRNIEAYDIYPGVINQEVLDALDGSNLKRYIFSASYYCSFIDYIISCTERIHKSRLQGDTFTSRRRSNISPSSRRRTSPY